MVGRRTIAGGFGLYALIALAVGLRLLAYALLEYRPDPHTGDVVGPPDGFWRLLVGAAGVALALPVLGLGALNAAAGWAVLRRPGALALRLACRVDAAVWGVGLLVVLVTVLGLGRRLAPGVTAAVVAAGLLVPLHLLGVRARPASGAPETR